MRIQDHQLAWRWTDGSHAIFPEETLSKMYALALSEAELLHRHIEAYIGRDGLVERLNPRKILVASLLCEDVISWLKACQSNLNQVVFLSWNQELAIKTTWGIFVENWPDFYYPVSDDLIIFSEAEEWVLLCHHENEFQFAKIA